MSTTAASYPNQANALPRSCKVENLRKFLHSIHHTPADVERCLEELTRMKFNINAAVIPNARTIC
jgi:hypothetical protein